MDVSSLIDTKKKAKMPDIAPGDTVRVHTKIVEGVNRIIISGDMVAADVVAMGLMKEYDDTFTPSVEAIVRRQQEHAEALGLGTSDLSQFEMIEKKV